MAYSAIPFEWCAPETALVESLFANDIQYYFSMDVLIATISYCKVAQVFR